MKYYFKLTIFSILLSVMIALLCYIFGVTLLLLSDLAFYLFPYNLLFLPLVGVLIIYIRDKYKKEVNGSMQKVFDATQINEKLPIHIVPFQMIMTWLSHLTGASVGREGVAIQLGATTSNFFANKFSFNAKLFTSVGKAAGFSALFGTPLAGMFFAFEMNRQQIKNLSFWYVALITTFLSSYLTEIFGLNHFHYHVEEFIKLDLINIVKILLIGLIFIFVGNLFVILLKVQRNFFSKVFKNDYIRIITLSIIFVIVMVLLNGRYMSLGTNLINAAFDNNVVLNVDFILKLFLTTYIIAIGYQGGEVTPLFAIGATLGVSLARLFSLPVTLIAALGYSSVFGNATKAYLASFFICIEIFGISMLPYILILTLINYLLANKISIYPLY